MNINEVTKIIMKYKLKEEIWHSKITSGKYQKYLNIEFVFGAFQYFLMFILIRQEEKSS